MTINPLLRDATIEDVDAIADVYLRSRKELLPFAPLIHTDESIHLWIRNNLLIEEHVVVAEYNGKIVGMMSLKYEGGIGWITQLYVSPDAVGRGVGTLMVQKAKLILNSSICLYTFQENKRARQFYERHGFLAINFDDGSCNEENCPAVLYEWKK